MSIYLKQIFKLYKFYFVSIFIIAIVASFFGISVNYKIKEIIDVVTESPHSKVWPFFLFLVLYKFLHHGMFFINRLFDIRYQPVLLEKVVRDMYSKTLTHSLHWFEGHLSGEISNKISDFQTNIVNLIGQIFQSLVIITAIFLSVFFLLKVNLVPGLILLTFILIYTPIIFFLLKKQSQIIEGFVNARQKTLGIINDSIANVFSVKVIGNPWTEFKLKLDPAIKNWRDWDYKNRVFDAYWVDNADTILIILMNAIQFGSVIYLFKNGSITAGDFAFISIITFSIHHDIDRFLDQLVFKTNPPLGALRASFEFLNDSKDSLEDASLKKLAPIKGNIQFSNVSFAYPDTPVEVLRDISFSIQAGEKIGIIGLSGAGKTTIIKCLLRYFDIQKGDITFDGQPVKEVSQDSLRAQISIIPQDISLFHRSLLENLQMAKEGASFEEIQEACVKASIHDDILRMPHGYDSIVGEKGVKISEGQRQRIAIARAILKNAPILILDEATSALDTLTEKMMQKSLNDLLQTTKATTLVIAHRFSTLVGMDRILVLDKGKIIEEGSHAELLNQNGLYKRLWEAQIHGFLPEVEVR